MPFDGAKTEVVLPFGLLDARGRRRRGAVLTPLNGRAELLGVEDQNPFRASLALLSASTVELGALRAEGVDIAVLSSLLPVDRDTLLLHLTRLTFGDIRYQTFRCPIVTCGKRIDIRLDLSTLSPPEAPPEAGGRLSLPDGRILCFRLPTAGDQIALHGLAAEALEAAFLERCVRWDGAPGDPAEILALPRDLRANVVRRVLAASPAIDATLSLECVECGAPFTFTYDPVTALLAELRASRVELMREVHALAFHYHWGHGEILSLPRALRREYLALLDEELTARRPGGLG